MNLIQTCECYKLLGRGFSDVASFSEFMLGHGFKPAHSRNSARKTFALWHREQVMTVVKKERDERAAAEAKATSVAAPAQRELLEDDGVKVVVGKLDGQSVYICRLGERVAKMETLIADLEATNRALVITNNRILKALGAEEVKFVAPERRVSQ